METYKSYRIYFCNEYTGKLNKFGGLPTHLPPEWPKDQYGEDKLSFFVSALLRCGEISN